MIDKTPTSARNYENKITAYLDGSLSPEERSEFEAFVSTHQEFRAKVSTKEKEIQKIREMVPVIRLSPSALESLGHELNQAVFNLLRSEPKSFWEGLKDRLEEWTS